MKKIYFVIFLILMNLAMPLLLAEQQAQGLLNLEGSAADGNDTAMVFNDAEIRDVLRLIADQYDLNIVMSDDVNGTVTLRLKDTSLNSTLDAVLTARGYDYEIRDNIIRVASAETIENERTQRVSKLEIEPLTSEVIKLSYLDAYDVQNMIKPMLTSRGTVSVLERRQYRGFQFGGFGSGGSQTSSSSSSSSSTSSAGSAPGGSSNLVQSRGEDDNRSSTLMLVDVQRQVEKIKEIIATIDVAPKQVLIDAKILEVATGTLEDLGLDLNTAAKYIASDDKVLDLATDINSGTTAAAVVAGSASVFSNAFPVTTDSGLHAVFRRMAGEDFTVVLHALLQDQRTKTLSAPQILTIENQEAAIIVGEQFPIFSSSLSDQGTATESLSFYQPVGIILQVIVQVTPSRDISMIIHPTVSSIGNFVTGSTGLSQPRINIREADTRVLVRNGETLVIGGLLEDGNDERYFKVPILNEIPVLGKLFTRRQVNLDQRNLLIFITPRIVDEHQSNLNEKQKGTLEAINQMEVPVFLKERRDQVRTLYQAAKKSYDQRNYDVARIQFLKVLSLDPNYHGARDYLKRIEGAGRS